MANPFDQFDEPTGPIMGPPPAPPKPAGPPSGYAGDTTQLTYIPGGPADPNAPGNPLANQKFDNIGKLRNDFNGLPAVKTYQEVLPVLAGAIDAPDNAQGDLTVLYSFSKSMDPSTGVREGEQEMARNTASLGEQAQVWLGRVQSGQRLPPEVRTQFIEAMRAKGRAFNKGYSQAYERYADLAKRYGFDPKEIVGDHIGDPFRADEEQYVREHNGPRGPIDPAGTGDIGFNTPNEPTNPLSPQQQAAYDAFNRANPHASPEQIQQFLGMIGFQVHNAEDIAKMRDLGAGVAPGSDAQRPPPDISDVRGGDHTSDRDAHESFTRGIIDVPTMGTFDKIAAGAGTVFNGGTFDENLDRQYAITDYDQKHHPYARMGGQVVGGAVLPMGEMSSLAQIATKGAAVGGAYGAGSSRSLADVPGNAVMGAVAGAAIPTALSAGGRGIAALARRAEDVPPLVDPATGELNQPMDAMTPANRVQSMRDYGMETITPGMAGGRSARVIEQGLNNVPGSAGVMEDVNGVAAKELRRSMQSEAQKFGSSKTLNEGGSELQKGAKEWMTRFDETTGKAYNAIPIASEAKAATNNTVTALQQLTSRVAENPELAKEISDPVLQRYLGAIEKGGLNWQGMKEFRTFIGNKIGQFRFAEDARTGDYRALYGALSEDMRDTAASMGPGALKAFERANTIKKQGEQRIEGALTSILGPGAKGSPERAAAAVQAMTQGGKAGGDIAKLAQVRASTIKSGAWDEIASTLIHLGGQPAKSEGRAFNPQTFVNWYADMSEPARAMLFKPELRKSLDGFVAMTQQLGRVKGLTNTSNTTPTMIGSGIVAGSGVLAASHPSALLVPILGGAMNWGMAKGWTSPTFVNLITGYTKAAASGSSGAVKSQLGRMSKLASTNPELRDAVENFMRSIANDNAGKMGSVAASPNQGPQEAEDPNRQ